MTGNWEHLQLIELINFTNAVTLQDVFSSTLVEQYALLIKHSSLW